MKKSLFTLLYCFMFFIPISAENITISSPDKKLEVSLFLKDNSVKYSVSYRNKVMLEESPLGLITNVSDFSKNLTFFRMTE